MRTDNQNKTVRLANFPLRAYKDITIQNFSFSALIDTGSDICIITKSAFEQLKNVKLNQDCSEIFGIGQSKIHTLGYILVKTKIDQTEFEWYFHVVEDSEIMYQSLIGSDILKVVDINLKAEGATFHYKKSEQNSTETSNENEINNYSEYQELIARIELKAICMSDKADQFKDSSRHLTPEQQGKLSNLIANYEPRQVKKSPVSMTIILKDDEPVRQGPRRLPLEHQKIVEKQVSDWIAAGICKPSNSEYAAPVVLVSKEDGTKRLCCDYRKLNTKIIKDNFPMMVIDEAPCKLQNAKVFTTLDLRNGFFHVPIDVNSQKFTSFVTHHGQFQFIKVPFGICVAPAVFCRYIAAIFQTLIQDGTIITYMDDVIIPSQTIQENLEKLEKVLQVAKDYGVEINWEKC